jgi:hypothetical protein
MDCMYIPNASLLWNQTRERSEYDVLMRKPDGKRPQGKIKLRWYDNIRKDHIEIEWKFVDWIHSVHDTEQWWAFVKTATKYEVPKKWW